VILWGTGFGPTQPPVRAGHMVTEAAYTTTLPVVTIGGVDAVVLGAALSPGLAGVYQVAIRVPDGVTEGDAVVKVSMAGVSTPDNVHVFVAPR